MHTISSGVQTYYMLPGTQVHAMFSSVQPYLVFPGGQVHAVYSGVQPYLVFSGGPQEVSSHVGGENVLQQDLVDGRRELDLLRLALELQLPGVSQSVGVLYLQIREGRKTTTKV